MKSFNRLFVGMSRKLNKQDIHELLKRCELNDNAAQVEVYRRYYRSMYNIALRLLDDSSEAEDVMQESFLSAFQKLNSYSGNVTFGAWLKRIVINRSLDVIKARKAIISLDAVPEVADDESEGGYVTYKDISADDIRKCIQALPEGYRIVLSLYLIEGYDHDEIAQILGVTSATSRTQYHRARKKLVGMLNELKAVS